MAYMAVRTKESLFGRACALSVMYQIPEAESRGMLCAFANDTVTKFLALTYDSTGKLYVVSEDGEEHSLQGVPPIRMQGLHYLCVQLYPSGLTFVHPAGGAYSFFPPSKSILEPNTFILSPTVKRLTEAQNSPVTSSRVFLDILHMYPRSQSIAQLYSIHDSRLVATGGQ